MTTPHHAPAAPERGTTTSSTTPRARRHLTSTSTLSRAQVEDLFGHAQWIADNPTAVGGLLAGKKLGVLFYQNSTRTRLSFEAAMAHLGGAVIGFNDVRTTRAGDFFQESLTDTVGVVSQYVDCLVLRHTSDGAAEQAAAVSPVPVINGGDGGNEHPTQALLDAWMMCRLLGNLDGARIGLVGDPACRDFRSLIRLLLTLGATELIGLPAPGTALGEHQHKEVDDAGVRWSTVDTVEDLLPAVDVISMLPVQLPNFHVGATESAEDAPELDERFRLTRTKLTRAARPVPVLHVGPRGAELPSEVDDLEQVHYFEQARAGMHLRAALLDDLIRDQHADHRA